MYFVHTHAKDLAPAPTDFTGSAEESNMLTFLVSPKWEKYHRWEGGSLCIRLSAGACYVIPQKAGSPKVGLSIPITVNAQEPYRT